MALKIDGKEEYALMINENRFDGELHSKEKVLEFLKSQYLSASALGVIGKQSGMESQSLIKAEGLLEEDLSEIFQIILFTFIILFVIFVVYIIAK